MSKNIAVIGAGWYGCYIIEYLIDNYPELNITVIDKEKTIFSGSSFNNQNRLHLGFHYPRCKITLNKSNVYYYKFIEKYNQLVESIDKNIYGIANSSRLNYETYISLFNDNEYNLIENNNLLANIDGKLINTKEKYINFEKSKNYFLDKFKNNVNYKLQYQVDKIEYKNNKVIINDDLEFDKVFNCTYNQLNTKLLNIEQQNIIYEKCISLIYKKINNCFFDSLTIMDGNFFSIYKYKNDLYTLTDVENTPFIKDTDFNKICDYKINNIHQIIDNFEKKVIDIYRDFKKDFVYKDYFISYKCKNITENDSRDINIHVKSNIFHVWCGKITFIFELDKYINDFVK